MVGDYDSLGLMVVPSELRGYRCWRLDRNNDLDLYPIHADLSPPWPRRRATASCDQELAGHMRREHLNNSTPVASCLCGFYASHQPTGYEGHMPRIWEGFRGKRHAFVHGTMIATGRVILGTRGFRSEYGRVEALWGIRARQVATYYNVPWFLTRKEFLKHYPPHDVSALLESQKGVYEYE